MEPNDLNSPSPPEDAALEAWLREQTPAAPLPDNGFSTRVLAALPAPSGRQTAFRHAAARRRLWLCTAGAILGVAVGWLGQAPATGGGNQLLAMTRLLDATLETTAVQLSHPAVGIVLGLTFASLLFAYWEDLRPWRRLVA